MTHVDLELLKHTLDQHAIVSIADVAGRITFVNDKFCEISQYSRDELLGQNHRTVKSTEHSAEFFKALWQTISSGQVWHGEIKNRRKDGGSYWVKTTIVPFLNERDKPYQYVSIRTDISDRKRTEEAMKLLSFVDPNQLNVFEAIARAVSIGLDTRWAGVGHISNDGTAIAIHGFCEGSIIGKPFQYAVAGTPCEQACAQQAPLLIADNVVNRFPDDTMLREMGAVSYWGEPLLDHDGTPTGIIIAIDDKPAFEDPTKRALLRVAAKRAAMEFQRLEHERELQQLTDQFINTLQSISDAFISLDKNWQFIFVNQQAERFLDRSWQELKGKNIWDALPEAASFFYKQLQRAAADQTPTAFEAYYPPLDVWFDVKSYPSAEGLSVYFRDITLERQAEAQRQKMEAQLRQAQKLEAIGILSGGIAHDFNNILASIVGYTSLAIQKYAPPESGKLRGYLDEVQTAANRARDLVKQILAYSRGEAGEPRLMSPAPIVKEVTKLLEATIPSSVTIKLQLDADAPQIKADPVQLHQAVMNLVINGCDAMNGQGVMEIGLVVCQRTDNHCSACQQKYQGDYVDIVVRDSGSGIPAKVLARMFDPFYSTKELGKGTGMGLSVVHGVVHGSGGHIQVESTLDQGTAIHLLFPLANQSTESSAEKTDPAIDATWQQGHGTIAVVDDEAPLVKFLTELLEMHGYTVIPFTDSRQALTYLEEHAANVDLVLTDQTMPQLKGTALAQALQKLHPRLPVILCTGYSEDLDQHDATALGIHAYLNKPVNPETLLTAIKEALEVESALA